MFACKNCFSDKELSAFIESSGVVGDCDVCESKKTILIDLSELLDFFQELLDNFRRTEDGLGLKSKIQESWSFFSSHSIASKILNEVIKSINTEIESADDLVDYTQEIIINYSYWDELKEKLKWKRRFLPDLEMIQDLGWDGFFNTQFELEPNDKLFRARVHHKSGMEEYSALDMMCPEPILAKGGRANPLGIPFLYLSDNDETILYEVRASYLDELSVGEFHLKKEYGKVKIVDFTEETLLFQPGRITETIKSRLLRQRISRDLSKPMRRYDTELEYIPTQFICEYIKVFTGASGIRFNSSLHLSGNNLVIFEQDKMECTNVSLQKVRHQSLAAIQLKKEA